MCPAYLPQSVAVVLLALATPTAVGCELPTKPATLADLTDYAFCANPSVVKARANLKAQTHATAEQKAGYGPSVNATTTTNTTDSSGKTSYSSGGFLTGSWVLFDSGARDAAVESALSVQGQYEALQKAQAQQLRADVASSFYTYLSKIADLDAGEASTARAQITLDVATVKYEAGAGSKMDMLNARASLNQAKQELAANRFDAIKLKGSLGTVIGAGPATGFLVSSVAPEPNEFAKSVEYALHTAQLRNPTLTAARKLAESAESDVEAAKAAFRPVLSANASVSRQGGTGSALTSTTLGLSLTMPLYDGGLRAERVGAAEERLTARRMEVRAAELQAASDVWNAYHAQRQASEVYALVKETAAIVKEAHAQTSARYKAGLATMLDLVTAQEKLAQAERTEIQARFAIYQAGVVLAKNLGLLE